MLPLVATWIAMRLLLGPLMWGGGDESSGPWPVA